MVAISDDITFADFSKNFDTHPVSGNLLRYLDSRSVSESLKNIINTSKGERLFNPDFGCSLRSLLFANADNSTETAIKKYIEDAIRNYEKRAILSSVKVSARGQHGYDVEIEYMLSNSMAPTKTEFFLERIR